MVQLDDQLKQAEQLKNKAEALESELSKIVSNTFGIDTALLNNAVSTRLQHLDIILKALGQLITILIPAGLATLGLENKGISNLHIIQYTLLVVLIVAIVVLIKVALVREKHVNEFDKLINKIINMKLIVSEWHFKKLHDNQKQLISELEDTLKEIKRSE